MSRQVRKKKLYLDSALRNRNGTSKLIDYKRGQKYAEQKNLYWKASVKKIKRTNTDQMFNKKRKRHDIFFGKTRQ